MGRPSGIVGAPTRTELPEMTLSAHPAPQSAAREEWGRAARGVLEHAVWTVESEPPRPFTRTRRYWANRNARLALRGSRPVTPRL
jgi:hypothetical protein